MNEPIKDSVSFTASKQPQKQKKKNNSLGWILGIGAVVGAIAIAVSSKGKTSSASKEIGKNGKKFTSSSRSSSRYGFDRSSKKSNKGDYDWDTYWKNWDKDQKAWDRKWKAWEREQQKQNEEWEKWYRDFKARTNQNKSGGNGQSNGSSGNSWSGNNSNSHGSSGSNGSGKAGDSTGGSEWNYDRYRTRGAYTTKQRDAIDTFKQFIKESELKIEGLDDISKLDSLDLKNKEHRTLLKKIYKKLAVKYHTNQTAENGAIMAKINDAADNLLGIEHNV